jgi:hypothetical protein
MWNFGQTVATEPNIARIFNDLAPIVSSPRRDLGHSWDIPNHLREKYAIDGNGFVWSHATMDSLEAMDWIERMFLTIEDSVWLPQWSFDFWIIPYLMGKGVRLDDFRDFMRLAQRLMALGVASVPEAEKAHRQDDLLQGLVAVAKRWQAVA